MEMIIVGVIAAFGGIIAAGIPVYLTQRRHPSRKVADGASIVEAAEDVVALLRGEVKRLSEDVGTVRDDLNAAKVRTDELEESIHDLERELDEYRKGVALLVAQISSLGHHPVWRPTVR